MAIITNDFEDGQVLTGARMNTLADNVNAHAHDDTSGSTFDLTHLTNKTANLITTSRSGTGGGTGRGSTVQNHIDTVGSATAGDNNPHGIEYGYLGDFTVADTDINQRFFWITPHSMHWVGATDNLGSVVGSSGVGGMINAGWPMPGMNCIQGQETTGVFVLPYIYPKATGGTGYIRVFVFFYAAGNDAGNVKIKMGCTRVFSGMEFNTSSSSITTVGSITGGTYVNTETKTGLAAASNYIANFPFQQSDISGVDLENRDILNFTVRRMSDDTATIDIVITGVLVTYYVGRPVSG